MAQEKKVYQDEVKDCKTEFIQKVGNFAQETSEFVTSDKDRSMIVIAKDDNSEDEDGIGQIIVAVMGTNRNLRDLATALLEHEEMASHFRAAMMKRVLRDII